MPRYIRLLTLGLLTTGFLLWSATAAVHAELLSHIDVRKENGIGVIHVVFTRPVIYTHHFPLDHGYLLHIFFNDLTLERGNPGTLHGTGRPDDEFMRSPPNNIVPVFWVAYNNFGTGDLGLDPFHLQVQFGQPVHFNVQPDQDNQGFYIFILRVDPPTTSRSPSLHNQESPLQQ